MMSACERRDLDSEHLCMAFLPRFWCAGPVADRAYPTDLRMNFEAATSSG